MKRYQDIGTAFVQLLLLTTLTNPGAGDDRAARKAERTEARCFEVNAPEKGRYWLTLRTRQPSTAPSLMVLGEAGHDPRAVDRMEATLFEIEQPGEQLVCFTSQAVVRKVEVAFEKVEAFDKSGDPMEVEVDEDPS